MQKRPIILITILTITLMIGLFISPPATMAITKVTPTPDGIQPPTDELDIGALLDQALEKINNEDYGGAINDLTAVIQLDETLWDAYFFRAFAYSQTGDENRAIDDYTRAISILPYDWTTYNLRGDLYYFTGDLAQANLDYEQVIYLNPRYAQAYAGKALLSLTNGDQTLAEIYQAVYEAIQASIAGDSDANIDILSAIIDNADTLSIPPELGYAYYNRANTYISLGNWDDALSDMNQAIDLQPHMQDYYMARGFVYSETNQLGLAAPDFYQRMTLIEITSITETLDFGKTVPVEIDYGTVARLTFSGNAGQKVTLTARDSLGVEVDPLLVLLDTERNPIAGNDDGGGELDSLIRDFELPVAGTYTVVVSHANGGFVGTVTVSLK